MDSLLDSFSAFGTMSKGLEAFFTLHGSKPVARMAILDDDLAKVEAFCRRNGLALKLADFKVAMQFEGGYSTKGVMVDRKSSQKGHLFIYFSKEAGLAERAKVAEQMQAYNVFGMLLGYPECCREFFVKHKPLEETFANDYVVPAIQNSKRRRFPFAMNIFGRYFDACLLSHAPCSLGCKPSLEIAQANFKLLQRQSPGVAHQLKGILTSAVIFGDEVILLPGRRSGKEFCFTSVLSTKKTALAHMLEKARRLAIIGQDHFQVGDSQYHLPLMEFN
ncbi:MAG: hypothetical protein V1735_05650 [Nanoarchaeota archaeon]